MLDEVSDMLNDYQNQSRGTVYMKNIKSKIIVVCGPTASGKSALAVSLARKFSGEIISADSRQVYRGLNI